MSEGYRPKYFELYELLPPELFTYDDMQRPKELQSGWMHFSSELLETIDIVRDIIGKPLICNTWYQNGNRRWSGFRPQYCEIGAAKSLHKEGKAVDIICSSYTAEEMRKIIKDNKDKLPYKIRIEDGVSWLHIDVKERKDNAKIYFFKA